MDKINEKERDSNFELLRIVSMIFIILYHIVLHGDFPDVLIGSFFSKFVYSFFYSGGKLGVVLFIMITGYFMALSKSGTNVKKLFRLEGQVLFYSILSFLLFLVIGNGSIQSSDIVRSFMPNMLDTYWFFSAYFALCFFFPYMNKLIGILSKKEFERLLLYGFVFLILIPSLIIYKQPMMEAVYLLYYYFVGAYIRLYCKKRGGGKIYFGIFILVYFLMIGVTMWLEKASSINGNLVPYIYFFSRISSVLVFICAITLFMTFFNWRTFHSRVINCFGRLSFGVYLFHEHYLLRDFWWNQVFKVSVWYTSPYFLVIGFLISILIYLMGSAVEVVRRFIFERALYPLVNFFWLKVKKDK